MEILLVTALQSEQKPLVDHAAWKSRDEYLTARVAENRIRSIVSGVGMISAENALLNFEPLDHTDLVINFGLAGCISDALHRGDIVYVNSVFSEDEPEMRQKLRTRPAADKQTAVCCSVQHPITDTSGKNRLYRETGCDIVDMELFALAKVLNRKRIPLVSYKIISDFANDKTMADYKKYSGALCKEISDFIRTRINDARWITSSVKKQDTGH